MINHFLKKYSSLANFRLRGEGSTRLEGLSDGIFALAIALLLISSSVPKDVNELLLFAFDFVPFALCILFIGWIWTDQRIFFHRYGLVDPKSTRLNIMLLFFVLFYVYPLKFLMTFLCHYFYYVLCVFFINKSYLELLSQMFEDTINSNVQMSYLMLIYGFGFFAIFATFLLLYRHALSLKEELDLNEVEIMETQLSIKAYSAIMFIALISLGFSTINIFTVWPWGHFFSGLCYSLIGPIVYFISLPYKKKLKELTAKNEKR